MPFEILTADGDGARRWSGLIGRLPVERRDIHFLPQYGRIYRDSYGFEPLLAVYTDGDDFILKPFVRRPLRELPFLNGAPDAATFSDIANPYGYGGPLANTSDPEAAKALYSRFADSFAVWCDKEDIASEFVSLHPFMVDHQLGLVGSLLSPKRRKDVVYVNLADDMQALTKKLRKGHRSSIALARRSHVRVEKVETTVNNLARFKDMYDATMVRRKAAERWFLPEGYFNNCVEQLTVARCSMFFASVDDVLESGCLLIHEFDTAYYHFAATYSKYPNLGVNNLMVYEAAAWMDRAGYARFHLGGGVTGDVDDPLLRFKSGFSDLRAPLYTYFCVRDQAAYDQLNERKRMHEKATTGAESTSDFLPIYRR